MNLFRTSKTMRSMAGKRNAAVVGLRVGVVLPGLILLTLILPASCLASNSEGPDAPGTQLPQAASATSRVCTFEARDYHTLYQLVTDVGRDAGRFFRDFYSQVPVTVQPFVFLTGSGEKRFTPMGAILADQMMAMVDNQQGTVVISAPAVQELKGVLVELNGYLRIHMSGVNAFDQRRSYTAEVEMSEALYRSLYADSF